jgi:P2 family phage contractile tail tube protein
MADKQQNVVFGGNLWMTNDNLALSVARGKLPDLTRAMADISSSGSYFGLQIPGEIEALTAEFDFNGPDRRIRARFGREPGDWTELYWYERIRDLVNGTNIGRVVYLKGLVNGLTSAGTTKSRADGPMGMRFTTIVHYVDRQDGSVIHEFDYFNNKVVVEGVEISADHNSLVNW